MAITKIAFFVYILSSAYFVCSFALSIENVWCSDPSYFELCKHMKSQPLSLTKIPKSKSEFRNMAVKLAMDVALKVQDNNKWLGSKCRNEKEKAAWVDCLTLYEDTIYKLNYTIDPNSDCTDFDFQTWLSAALTNLDTCTDGFYELGVPDYVLPLMSNDVSKLISNILAINKDLASPPPENYTSGYPNWVSPGDRKLLQASSPQADLVVAQDGSGNFKTITAALDAAAKRSGTRRFVIHIKRGIYRENLVIANNLKNIMLIGDGMRYTIITGSRSVVGGSTTFNSATVGT